MKKYCDICGTSFKGKDIFVHKVTRVFDFNKKEYKSKEVIEEIYLCEECSNRISENIREELRLGGV